MGALKEFLGEVWTKATSLLWKFLHKKHFTSLQSGLELEIKLIQGKYPLEKIQILT